MFFVSEHFLCPFPFLMSYRELSVFFSCQWVVQSWEVPESSCKGQCCIKESEADFPINLPEFVGISLYSVQKLLSANSDSS